MEIKKAVRKAIPAIILFYGRSGSGKTYSALKLAQGMISDDKRICLIDTENGRASHYADEFDFDVIDLEPPFSPARYIEAINLARNNNKYGVIITDSISHEWEGLGGCCDIADEISESLRKKGSSGDGLNIWAKPKAEHKKFTLNNLFRSKIPIICCARAKEELEQVKVDGKSKIVKKGLVPIQEKNFPYEMLVTFKMEGDGKFVLEKSSTRELKTKLSAIKSDFINEEFGKVIANWVSGGERIDSEALKLKEDARDVAMNEGELALKEWFSNLSDQDKLIANRLPIEFKRDLNRIARDRDQSEVENRNSNSGSISVASLKTPAKEPIIETPKAPNPEPVQTDIEYFTAAEDQEVDKSEEIFKKHEVAIKSYQNEKSLNAHFNYLNTKDDLKYLETNAPLFLSKLNVMKAKKLEEFKDGK